MKHHITEIGNEIWVAFPDYRMWISVYPWDARTTHNGQEVYPFSAWGETENGEMEFIYNDEVLFEDWDTNGVLSITHAVKACVAILAMTGEEETK
tara:strand:+ start:627 stop:911 length:285 start_codon:yes stop_codon:yes gene_type:complete